MRRGPPKKPFPKGKDNPGSRARRKQTGSGRVRGTPNKVTADIKQHILNALNDPSLGGERWFIRLGQRDLRSMAGLVGKIIPAKVETVDPEETAAKIRERNKAMHALTQSKKEDGKK